MRTAVLLGSIMLAWGMAAAEPAQAQAQAQDPDSEPIRGVLEATALDRLPADAAFDVRPVAASPMDQAMRDALVTALRDAGRTVGGARPYTLTFQLTGDVPDYVKRPDIEIVGQGGSENLEDVELKMRWRLSRGEEPPSKSRILVLSLVDPDKHTVWEAKATIKATSADEFEIVSAVAPKIVANIGQQVMGLALP